MKKKHFKKFKPVQELYDHGDTTLLNSKAVGLSKVSLEESTADQASVDVVTNHRQLHNSEGSMITSNSGQSSSSEAFLSLNSLKTPVSFEDQPMFHNVLTESTPEYHDQDIFDYQGDVRSCISKEDEVMISGDHFGGADHKNNATSNLASFSSSCPVVLKKSLIGESVTNGYPVDHMSVDEGDHNSMRAHSSEAVLLGKGFRDELNFSSPSTSVQKPHLQNQNVMHGDGSEELVDVRVCDICGDAGRETLLALCSKCSDGSEHIYCMTPKMNKVPESDWLCGECLLMRDPKRHQQAVVERSDNASKSSFSKELSQDSSSIYTAVKHVGKTRNIRLSKSSGLSNKKLEIDVSTKTKKRTIDQRVQPTKISGSVRQTRLTQVSSLKNMEKRKDSADQVSSFVDLPAKKVVKQAGSSRHSSLKPEQQFCGGTLNSLEVHCSGEDVHQRRSCSKENADCELKKKHPGKKLFKSLSCTRIGPIPLDVSNIQSSAPSLKGVKCGNGKNSTEKSSQEHKTSRLRQTRVVSKIIKGANSSRKNVEEKKTIQVDGNTNVKPLGPFLNKGKNCMSGLDAGSVEEKKPLCHSSYVVNSPDVNGDADLRVNLSTKKAKFDDSDHSLPSHKILSFDVQDLKVMPMLRPADIDHMIPSAISAVPESWCIWKGTFKLDKGGKITSDCYGVQAHLSTHTSSKVDELVFNFSTELQLMEVPRVLAWPTQFQKNYPTEQDIALYFFAQDCLSYQRSYRKLLEVMTSNDLALEANFGGFQLLVFPSSLLPENSQCWNSLPYLWGVFRVKKLDDSFFSNLNISPSNQILGSPVSCGSNSKFVSPSVNGSAFASHTSHKSMEETKSVDPGVLQSSASMKSRDQSSEHEVPLLQEDTLKEHHLQAGTTVRCDDWRFEGFDRGLQISELQKERFSDEDAKSVSNVDIFRYGKSTTPVGLRSDVASGSSLSLDSGPSGLSDSGWYAKSANEEPFEHSGSHNNAINLDLCLWNRPVSEEIDLDLALGFPSRRAYQSEDYVKNHGDQDGNVSLVLSLGMPYSNL